MCYQPPDKAKSTTERTKKEAPMHTTPTVQPRFSSTIAVMIALLIGSLLLPAARGQAAVPTQADATPPVMSVTDIYVTTTSSEGTTVNYRSTIRLSDDTDPAPTLTCTPSWGSFFALGKTVVSCTATDATGNSAQASLRILVAQADDTDIAMRQIFINPSAPQAGTLATFIFDISNSQLAAARSVSLIIDMPPEVELLSAPADCDVSALPAVICPLSNLSVRQSRSLELLVKINPDAIGTLIMNASVSLGDNQRDIDPDNNSFSISSPITPPEDLTGLMIYVPMVFN